MLFLKRGKIGKYKSHRGDGKYGFVWSGEPCVFFRGHCVFRTQNTRRTHVACLNVTRNPIIYLLLNKLSQTLWLI